MNLEKKGAVARQDMDNAVGDMNSKKAIVDSAAANVKRLEDLQSYEKVYAPFDGVITARNTDIGALIAAGSGGTGKELFHISAINRLRVFISVPEDYEQAAQERRRRQRSRSTSFPAALSPDRSSATRARSIWRPALCWSKWMPTIQPARCFPARTSQCI